MRKTIERRIDDLENEDGEAVIVITHYADETEAQFRARTDPLVEEATRKAGPKDLLVVIIDKYFTSLAAGNGRP